MSDPEQELFLFIGGQQHGDTKPIMPGQDAVDMPMLSIFPGGTATTSYGPAKTERYRKLKVDGSNPPLSFYALSELSGEDAQTQYKAYIRENA